MMLFWTDTLNMIHVFVALNKIYFTLKKIATILTQIYLGFRDEMNTVC